MLIRSEFAVMRNAAPFAWILFTSRWESGFHQNNQGYDPFFVNEYRYQCCSKPIARELIWVDRFNLIPLTAFRFRLNVSTPLQRVICFGIFDRHTVCPSR